MFVRAFKEFSSSSLPISLPEDIIENSVLKSILKDFDRNQQEMPILQPEQATFSFILSLFDSDREDFSDLVSAYCSPSLKDPKGYKALTILQKIGSHPDFFPDRVCFLSETIRPFLSEKNRDSLEKYTEVASYKKIGKFLETYKEQLDIPRVVDHTPLETVEKMAHRDFEKEISLVLKQCPFLRQSLGNIGIPSNQISLVAIFYCSLPFASLQKLIDLLCHKTSGKILFCDTSLPLVRGFCIKNVEEKDSCRPYELAFLWTKKRFADLSDEEKTLSKHVFKSRFVRKTTDYSV